MVFQWDPILGSLKLGKAGTTCLPTTSGGRGILRKWVGVFLKVLLLHGLKGKAKGKPTILRVPKKETIPDGRSKPFCPCRKPLGCDKCVPLLLAPVAFCCGTYGPLYMGLCLFEAQRESNRKSTILGPLF